MNQNSLPGTVIPEELKKVVFLKINMMGGKSYQIDPDEYILVKTARERNSWVKLRQAEVFAGSIASIELDLDRTRWYHKQLDSVVRDNKYRAEKDPVIPFPKPEPLRDCFADVDAAAELMDRISGESLPEVDVSRLLEE